MSMNKTATGAALALALMTSPAHADQEQDRQTIAAIDTAYQAAVERNDADAMAAILHEDFILVLGNGAVYTRDDLLNAARTQRFIYERQIEDAGTQTVRMYGDHTATVTALLWVKAAREGQTIDYRLWFTDTYVRTPQGWRYAFGQASLPLPDSGGER